MDERKITLEEVRASLNPNIRAEYKVRWFGRPLANLATPLFFNNGWSANGVTALRALLGCLGILMILSGNPYSIAFAAAVVPISLVLDCIDGNLARLHGSVSYWGKFIDGLADMLFLYLAPIAAGFSLVSSGAPPMWLMLGALVTVGSLICQMVRYRLSFMREWMTHNSGPLTEDELRRVGPIRDLQSLISSVQVNAIFFTPLALAIPENGCYIFLLLAFGLQLIPDLLWTLTTMLEARKLLARPRRSIHSV